MNFDLSEEQELFCTSVERFNAPIDVEARRKLRLSPTGYDRERWQQLAELGLITLAAGEEADGLGGSTLDLALVAEAIGKANSPDPWLELGAIPTMLIEAGGTSVTLNAVMSGESVATLAWAERAQRYNLDAKATKAEATDSGFVVSGEKTFVMGAALADFFVVTASFGGGTVPFVVSKEADGVDVRPYRLADGSIAGEVMFRNVRVDKNAQLSGNEESFALIVAEARIYAAAEMVGLGQRLLDDTLNYVKEREQFGVAIGSFQALQHRLVEAYAKIEQCRSMLYRAALTDRTDYPAIMRAAAGAKAFIGENIDAVAREAVQMHGGMGITDELAIGHALKRVMVLARLFGDSDAMLAEYALAA